MANFFDRINPFKTIAPVGNYESDEEMPPQAEKVSPGIEKAASELTTENVKKIIAWEDRRKEDTLYGARPSILIGFPMSKPKSRPDGMHLVYRRSNGDFKIEILSDPRCGVPYGQDQLFVLAIVDHALKQGSPKVEIGSIYKILKELGMTVDGRKYKLIQQTILRVFGSVATYWYQEGSGITGERCFYFKKVHLEILKDKYDYKPADGDYIILSDELFKDLKEHPIPYDLEMLRRLKRSEGATRLYLWAAQRAFRVSQGTIFIPLEDLANDLGSDISKNPRKFKQNLKSWVLKVEKELLATLGQKFLIKILDKGVILYKGNLVAGAHRKQLISIKPVSHSKKKSKPHKEFDLDWVLEKEIEDFNAGLRPSISQQAVKYKSEKAESLKA